MSADAGGTRASRLGPMLGAAGLVIVAIFGGAYAFRDRSHEARPLAATVAEVQAVHAPVTAAGAPVLRVRRLALGAAVETAAEGRARLRLDDGTSVVIDGGTRVVVSEKGLTLERGRIFVQGAPSARTEIGVAGAVALVTGSNVAASRPKDGAARVYAASGDVTVRLGGDVPVHVGETASIEGGKIAVAPERAFDDWTGGLAAPWGASGPPRRAVGELWGRPVGVAGEIGSPLTLRAHEVSATLFGELAQTEVRTRFFHAGSAPVDGDFRMAVPAGAIVSRFAAGPGESPPEGSVGIAARGNAPSPSMPAAMLEWAGEGWVRGRVGSIAPGELVTVVVTYIEWLSPQPTADGASRFLQYRFPMVSDGPPPLIGEFSARIDARAASPRSVAAGLGAVVTGAQVELRRSDYRPSADLVVDIETAAAPAPARLYSAPAPDDDDGGDFVLVRAELPEPRAEEGVSLALVIDTSGSIEPAMLDAARASVESIVTALGPRDRVVVLAADDGVHPVGPARMGPVDEARRKAILEGLSTLSLGGASDLGRALEAAADALDPAAPSPMVVYVGDGWPSMGDLNADAIRARLARRAGGAPRMGAIAIGPVANRFALSALVRGGGPSLEVSDREGAAATAMTLLADALRPALADVELVLGPSIEQVYPRGPRSVAAGDTVWAVGRARGETPTEAVLRYRDGKGPHEMKLAIRPVPIPLDGDVRRRWAAARVEEIALSGRGREAATDVALRTGLLTPWTAFVVGLGPRAMYAPTPLASRTFDLASGAEAIFTSAFETPRFARVLDGPATEMGDEPDEGDDPEGYRESVRLASTRILDEAYGAFRACRDSRAALKPDLGGALTVSFDVDGGGHAARITARGVPGADDASLNQCLSVVIAGLAFPPSGLGVVVHVTHTVQLLQGRAPREGKCSATSLLPLALRRGVWNERLATVSALETFLRAKRGCELARWTDRRALLELVLTRVTDGSARLRLAGELDAAAEPDASSFVRREALRRAGSPEELRALRAEIVRTEHYPAGTFRTQYVAAPDDAARLGVVARFLALAPHDGRLRRLQLLLLESTGQKERLLDAAREIRRDALADAGLLAEAAGALRRSGDELEARRTYGEIVERAPADPWARAFAGDRYRSEGWFDDAIRVYDALDALVGDDPASILRPALAHGAAGRLDLAERMLARATQQGGRGAAPLGELAGDLAQVLVGEARARAGVSPADAEELRRRAIELPARADGVVVVRAPSWGPHLEVALVRGPAATRQSRPADVAAAGLGIYSVRIDPSDASGATLTIAMKKQLAPARPLKVRVSAVIAGRAGEAPTLSTVDVDVPVTGKAVELRFERGKWVDG